LRRAKEHTSRKEERIAEITHKRRGELLRGIFKILKAHPDGLQAKDVLSKLEEVVPPTEFEKTNYPSNPNQRRFEKIARFTTIPTVKAGWLVKEKGNWSLTEEGLKAFESLTDPENFAKEAFRLYKEWKQDQPVPDVPEGEEDANAATTLEEAEESAWASIEEHLLTMNPYTWLYQKTEKTPRKEIERAKGFRSLYNKGKEKV